MWNENGYDNWVGFSRFLTDMEKDDDAFFGTDCQQDKSDMILAWTFTWYKVAWIAEVLLFGRF